MGEVLRSGDGVGVGGDGSSRRSRTRLLVREHGSVDVVVERRLLVGGGTGHSRSGNESWCRGGGDVGGEGSRSSRGGGRRRGRGGRLERSDGEVGELVLDGRVLRSGDAADVGGGEGLDGGVESLLGGGRSVAVGGEVSVGDRLVHVGDGSRGDGSIDDARKTT